VGLLEIHHGVLAEHAPFSLCRGVDGDVTVRRLAARSLDVAQGLEQAVLGADGSVLLDKGDGGEPGALRLDAATDFFGGDVVCHVGVPLVSGVDENITRVEMSVKMLDAQGLVISTLGVGVTFERIASGDEVAFATLTQNRVKDTARHQYRNITVRLDVDYLFKGAFHVSISS